MNCGVPNSAANSSGPSVGASSMVTDANSALSGGPHLQRSASINTDSYLRLPASPMSFSSNNISGSSLMDGGSMIQQTSQHDHTQKQVASSATSHHASHDPGFFSQASKKPRFDTRQDDLLHPQLIQQLLQRQDPMHLQGHPSPQMQALIQQKLLQQRHQQQMLQSLPPMQRMQLLQHQQQQLQQQQQLRQHLPQQVMQQGPYIKRPYDSGICARRLMQYLYHQRHRPPDNNILYWRKFVTEYFAPHAKMKWCLSSYDNASNQVLGAFPQAAIDAAHCNICGSKSGKGFEATFEALPRLSKIKFDSGITDELLFVDMPNEHRLNTGVWLLEYAKAVQESVYEQLRVIREGQLRIIFTPDLKIISWEFCTRHHEEYLSRRLVAPQVNQMVQVAQKYQNAINEAGPSGISAQDLQTNCNTFVTAGRQLAKNLELQSLNDLGFSKRYIRCLQIAEVVTSLKDVIDLTRDKDIGPIEALKLYPQQAAAKLRDHKVQEAERPLPYVSVQAVQSLHASRSLPIPGTLNNTAPNTISLNSYQALLRQNSNMSALHRDTISGSSQPQLQGCVPPSPTLLTNSSVGGSVAALQQQVSNGNLSQQSCDQASQVNQHMQQHAIQQLLQEMMTNNSPVRQQPLHGPNVRGPAGRDTSSGVSSALGLPSRSTVAASGNELEFASAPILNNASSLIPNTSNNFRPVSNNPNVGSSNNFILRQDLPESLHFADIPDISLEFPEWNI